MLQRDFSGEIPERVIYNGLTGEVVDPTSILPLHETSEYNPIIKIVCTKCGRCWPIHRFAWNGRATCIICRAGKTVREALPGELQ